MAVLEVKDHENLNQNCMRRQEIEETGDPSQGELQDLMGG